VPELWTLGVIAARLYFFMGKKSKKGRNRQETQQIQVAPPTPPRKGILRWLRVLSPTGWFWTSVSLFVALVGSYYLLRPQIEVEPDTALDPKQPMTTPFRITNRGVLPIYNVRKECGVKKLETDQSTNQRFTMSELSIIDDTEPVIPRLDGGESTSVFIPGEHFPFVTPDHPIVSGDIDVVVDYTTAIVRIHRKQYFRFETRKDINNEIRWYHKASSE
jgi:hypothetical protein